MNSKNPFATPTSIASQPAPNDWLARLLPNAKATFLRWEFWRVIYCTFCIAATVVFMFLLDKFPTNVLPEPPPAKPLNSWAEYIVAGVIANICFFAGPVVDTYLNWLGIKTRWAGIGLLVVGTTFTVVASFLAVSGYLN